MRLDRLLSDAGIGTRSEVKEFIKKGRIRINGEIIKKPDYQCDSESKVLFDGMPVGTDTFEYYLLYKPKGYLTAKSDREKPVVMDLIASKRKDLSPAGRLDEDTEGVLLITDDGALLHYLITPKNRIEKQYYAELDRPLPDDAGERLSRPIEFKDFTSKSAKFEKISDTAAYLTVTEGKYHEVKRLFHHIGCEVTYLRRERFDCLTLQGLKTGESRRLTDEEIKMLKDGRL